MPLFRAHPSPIRIVGTLALAASFVISGLHPATAQVADLARSAGVESVADASASVAQAFAPDRVVRYSGTDRYDVSARLARDYAPGVRAVYIVTGTNYPDALSAAPAAAAEGGPLLLVLPNRIPAVVQAELVRLQPERIVIVGGSNSVSAGVEDALRDLAPTVDRVSGADRYEASRNLVEYAFGESELSRLYVATGTNFPDALAASAAAGARGGAVLLVFGRADGIDAATSELVTALSPGDIVVAGGTASVSNGIEGNLRGLVASVTRLGGSDRYEAARNINAEAFPSAERVFIATGLNFPDALAGAAVAGAQSAPLYIVPGRCVPYQVAQDISALAPQQLDILGGTNSVGTAVESLTVCRNAPSAVVSQGCGGPVSWRLSNPNPYAITVDLGVDQNLDGFADTRQRGVPLAALETRTVTTPGQPEDTVSSAQLIFDNRIISTTRIAVDCIPPVQPPVVPPPVVQPPVYYENCDAVRRAGKAPLYRGQPGYESPRLDRDGDGIACEN